MGKLLWESWTLSKYDILIKNQSIIQKVKTTIEKNPFSPTDQADKSSGQQ